MDLCQADACVCVEGNDLGEWIRWRFGRSLLLVRELVIHILMDIHD